MTSLTRWILGIALSIFTFLLSLRPAYSEDTLAYLVAFGAYKQDRLDTSVNDLASLEAALVGIGVKVQSVADKGKRETERFISNAIKEIHTRKGITLFYIKGHGWSEGRRAYVATVDEPESSDAAALEKVSVSLNDVVNLLSYSNSQAIIFILDACRNDLALDGKGPAAPTLPLENSVLGGSNFIFLYSAAPGMSAYEGKSRLSSFGRALSYEITNSSSLDAVQLLMKVASTSNRLSLRKNEPLISNPYVVNVSKSPVYINKYDLPAVSLSPFADDTVVAAPISPIDWAARDLRFPIESEVDEHADQPLVGFDSPGEVSSKYLLADVRRFFASQFDDVLKTTGIDANLAKYGQSNDQILWENLYFRRLSDLPSGDVAFIAKLNWVPLCGAAGNCPILFIRGTRGESIDWSFELDNDQNPLIEGGNHVYVAEGYNGDHQIFIVGHGGSTIDGVTKYIWGYGLNAEQSIDQHRDELEAEPEPEPEPEPEN